MNDMQQVTKTAEIFSMSAYRGAVMPIVNRGKTPSWDNFRPVKLSKAELMHFFVQAPHTEYTMAWAERKVYNIKGQGATTAEIENVVNKIYSNLYLDRINRWQDLLALQVGQCLSNFDMTTNTGFISQGLIHNDDACSKKEEIDLLKEEDVEISTMFKEYERLYCRTINDIYYVLMTNNNKITDTIYTNLDEILLKLD